MRLTRRSESRPKILAGSRGRKDDAYRQRGRVNGKARDHSAMASRSPRRKDVANGVPC